MPPSALPPPHNLSRHIRRDMWRATYPFSGTVYVFRAKRADRVKLVFWDGTGVVLVAKRLEEGQFRWPKVQDGVMRLTAAELSALLEGLDWKRVHAPRQVTVPTVP